MVYVSQGNMMDNRSPWRLSIIPEMFWGLINFIVLFFRTLIYPNMTKYGDNYSYDYRSDGRGPPPPPRRRMGGLRFGSGPSPPPMAGGG